MGWIVAAAVYCGVLWWFLREQARRNRNALWCPHFTEKFFSPRDLIRHVTAHERPLCL